MANNPIPTGRAPQMLWAWISGGCAVMVVMLICCGGAFFAARGIGKMARQAEVPEKVTRANYQKLRPGMSLAEAQDLLGTAKENVRAGEILNVTWASKDGRCIISGTWQGHGLAAQAIFGD